MSTKPTPTETRPTMNTQTETRGAPLMFSTENETPIKGLFTAESEEYEN